MESKCTMQPSRIFHGSFPKAPIRLTGGRVFVDVVLVNWDELYQDIVLNHSRTPRNFGEPPGATVHVHGDNPMCGDEVSVHLGIGAADTVDTIGFTGNGCSICMASASMMTQRVKGRVRNEAAEMADEFQKMLTAPDEIVPDERLGDARVLQTVRKFPQRVKCATLAWHALRQALDAAESGEGGRQFSIEES
jgi:nitrogen fixation NifU-like protein